MVFLELTLIGQSTVLIKLDSGIVILTDPWFESYGFIRAVPIAMKPEEIPRCDLILASHKHIDHLDRAALRFARERGAVFIGSRRAAKAAAKAHIEDVRAVEPGDHEQFRGVKIFATLAYHPLAKDAVGFVIEAERRLYFSGDTRYDKNLALEVKAFSVNAGLLQIACSRYFGKDDGMNLHDAAKFAAEADIPVAIPIHYQVKGKTLDPRCFLELLPPNRAKILIPGQPLRIS